MDLGVVGGAVRLDFGVVGGANEVRFGVVGGANEVRAARAAAGGCVVEAGGEYKAGRALPRFSAIWYNVS